MTVPANTRATIIPCLRYRDAHAAIDWLCRAFSFERHGIYEHEGKVMHAQLIYGNGMVMLGSADVASGWGQLIAQPDEIGGRETQSPCIVVADAAAHHAQAVAAGAEVVIPLAEQGYRGSGYACRDLEGHIWWFGDYDPWREG